MLSFSGTDYYLHYKRDYNVSTPGSSSVPIAIVLVNNFEATVGCPTLNPNNMTMTYKLRNNYNRASYGKVVSDLPATIEFESKVLE